MPAVRCQCGAKYKLPDGAAGKKARCKECGKVFRVPEATRRSASESQQLQQPAATDDPFDDLVALAQGEAVEPPEPVVPPVPALNPAAAASAASPPTGAPPPPAPPPGVPAPPIETGYPAGGYSNFFRDVGRAFGFIGKPDNLVKFLILCLFVSLAPIAGLFVCFGGFLVVLAIHGWLYSTYFESLGDAANGELDLVLPGTEGDIVRSLLMPLVKYAVSWILVQLPCGIYLAVHVAQASLLEAIVAVFVVDFEFAQSALTNARFLTYTLLYALGIFVWPMILLVVALGEIPAVIRLDLILMTIVRTLPSYAITVGITMFAMFLPLLYALAGLVADPSMIWWKEVLISFGLGVVEIFGMLVAMRIIGLHYRHFKTSYAWDWG